MSTEFHNLNQLINYPFQESASFYDVSGGLELRPKFVVDFVVYGVDPGQEYYLSKIIWVRHTRALALCFQDALGNSYAEAPFTLPSSDNGKERYHTATFSSDDALAQGRVVIDANAAWNLFKNIGNDMEFYFAPEATSFVQGVVIPAESAVTTLSITTQLEALFNNVKLKEGQNITLRNDTDGIEISSFQGGGAGYTCADHELCYSKVDPDLDGVNEKLCGLDKGIGSFGGAQATDDCGIFIRGDSCLRVWKYPDKHMIVLHNECTEVCDEEQLLAEINCRICTLKLKWGMIGGDCTADCADAPAESSWHHIPSY